MKTINKFKKHELTNLEKINGGLNPDSGGQCTGGGFRLMGSYYYSWESDCEDGDGIHFNEVKEHYIW